MERYNIGDVWWVHFPYSDKEIVKRRPAIIIAICHFGYSF